MPIYSRLLKRKNDLRSRFMALFSYLSVLCLIPLIFNKDDEYVDFHARQGVVLWIWGVIAIFGLKIPVIGGFFFSLSFVLIALFSLIGIISVLTYRAWKIPIIGMFSRKL
ncbi:MAG: hypothetical protein HQL72_07170 [Magnetococcales bacterium]|nr:hypothetical protein [Magnetococcales bacterium]